MASRESIARLRQEADARLAAAITQIGEILGVEQPTPAVPVHDIELRRARQMMSIAEWAEKVAAVVASEAKQGAKHG